MLVTLVLFAFELGAQGLASALGYVFATLGHAGYLGVIGNGLVTGWFRIIGEIDVFGISKSDVIAHQAIPLKYRHVIVVIGFPVNVHWCSYCLQARPVRQEM